MKNHTKKNSSTLSSIKIKFIFILILSNASMFLFLSSTDHEIKDDNISHRSIIREDYIKLKLKVDLKTPLTIYPVILTNKKSSFVIRNVFIHSLLNEDSLQLSESLNPEQEVIIEVPKAESSKLLNQRDLVLYPTGISLSPNKKRKSYEINF